MEEAPNQQLPNRKVAYAESSYWDNRYRAHGSLSFEWFYGWTALRQLIRAQLPKGKPIIQLGCGNSNLQEGMAQSGYQVTNLDISTVVIDLMKEKHAHIPGLTYVVGDCRDMRDFRTCSFAGAIEKGTIDALLCDKKGVENVTRMCAEVSRVLQPGCAFLAISLGEPSARVALLSQPEFGWQVSVFLLPRLPPEHMVQAPDRPLPINDSVKPIKPMGPYRVTSDFKVEGLPEPWDASAYFYAYVCRKPKLMLKADSKVRGLLPECWKTTTKQEVARLQEEMGLHKDLFSRGIRKRHMRMSQFLAQQASSGRYASPSSIHRSLSESATTLTKAEAGLPRKSTGLQLCVCKSLSTDQTDSSSQYGGDDLASETTETTDVKLRNGDDPASEMTESTDVKLGITDDQASCN